MRATRSYWWNAPLPYVAQRLGFARLPNLVRVLERVAAIEIGVHLDRQGFDPFEVAQRLGIEHEDNIIVPFQFL